MYLAPKQRTLFKTLDIYSRQLLRIETPFSTCCRGSLLQFTGQMQVPSWEPWGMGGGGGGGGGGVDWAIG